MPQLDPAGAVVQKVDTNIGDTPQGTSTFAGAEFTVRYYDGQYSTVAEAEASGAPTRTWVFTTDADGFAEFTDVSKVGGDPLYYSLSGDPSMPIGTVLIQETKAPRGYNLDNGYGAAPDVFLASITPDSNFEFVYTYNSPIVPDTVQRGDFRLVKEAIYEKSDIGGVDSPRDLVQGVKFELYNDSDHPIVSPETGRTVEVGGLVCIITTDENGLASTKNGAAVNGWDIPKGWNGALAYGTYRIHEVIPDDVQKAFQEKYGHTLMPVEDWKTVISYDGQYSLPALICDDIPQTPLKIVKTDYETGQMIPLQCEFQLFDADGRLVTYTTHYPVTETMDTWTSNERGELTLPFFLSDGEYEIREVTAPEGYVKTFDGVKFEVGTVHNNWDNPIIVEFANKPQKATVTLAKTDGYNESAIAGAVYELTAASDIVTGDGTLRLAQGDVAATLITDENGVAVSEPLYLGTYALKETVSPSGYVKDVNTYTITLAYEGQDVEVFNYDQATVNWPNELTINKVNELDLEQVLPGAVFHLYNDDGTFDQELTTDENGQIYCSHLPKGDYHLTEVAPPDGYENVDRYEDGCVRTYDFEVNEDGLIMASDLEDPAAHYKPLFVNQPKVMNTTAIAESTGRNDVQAAESLTIVDTIIYNGLVPGFEYTVFGRLMDKATGEPALDDEGNEIVASTVFVAQETEGAVDVVFTFPGKTLGGKNLVAFETMTYEGKEYMVHADIEDKGQTVAVLDMKTTAYSDSTKHHDIQAAESLTIVDTVAYVGLTPGNEYTLRGILMDRITGGVALDDEGNEIRASVAFTPEESEGSVDVIFTFPGKTLGGKVFVAFETMLQGDNVVLVHADINDVDQTVTILDMRTTATDATTGTHEVQAAKDLTIVDTIAYRGLTPGCEYVATGKLVDKATGKPAVDDQGKEVTAQTKFVPEESEGSVDVTFSFSGRSLGGVRLVAFESVSFGERELMVHADIDDAEQTVTVVDMETTATSKETGTHEAKAAEKLVIVDTVSFYGLIPGEKYTVTGKLMDKATGYSALDDNGNPITAATTFVAKASNGAIDVTFVFSGTKLAGKRLVAFETMTHEGKGLMVHADIEDAEQTVNVLNIETKAHDEGTGTNVGTIDSNDVLVDKVAYTGLTPGKTYTLKTLLVLKDSEEALESRDGKPFYSSIEFIPESPDGSVDVTFAIDSTDLEGQSVVFYEYLYDDGGRRIAEHADSEDTDQTICYAVPDEPIPEELIPEAPEAAGKPIPQTGAFAELAQSKTAPVITTLLTLALGIGYAIYRYRSKVA